MLIILYFFKITSSYFFQQWRREVHAAQGSDHRSRGHSLHWRRLWVRHLLPHQISCCSTKGLIRFGCSSLLYISVIGVFKVSFRTTGNGSVRFNPNLYNCGKVIASKLWKLKPWKLETFLKIVSPFFRFVSLCLAPGRVLRARRGTLRPRQ